MSSSLLPLSSMISFFFFNDTATTEIYTLSLHDALPISRDADLGEDRAERRRAPRSDPAAGRAAGPQGEPRPARPRHGARGDPGPRQGPARDGPGPERHPARRGRLHLRPVLRTGARHVQRARRDRDRGRSLDPGPDPRLRRRARGGRHLQRDGGRGGGARDDRKSTRLNSSHGYISYAVFCLKKKKKTETK